MCKLESLRLRLTYVGHDVASHIPIQVEQAMVKVGEVSLRQMPYVWSQAPVGFQVCCIARKNTPHKVELIGAQALLVDDRQCCQEEVLVVWSVY